MRYIFIIAFACIRFAALSQSRTLEDFVREAQQNSPVLKEFSNQISSNRLDSMILRATFKTQVNFITSNSYSPVVKGYGYDGAITNGANISALVQASRSFFTPANMAAQYRTITLQNLALADSISISEQDIKRAVIDWYITAYGDQVTLDFNKDVYALLQKEEGALKKLTQSGIYKQTDYLTFYVTLQQQALTLSQAQAQYNADYLTLNYLAGIVDTTVYRVQAPLLNGASQMELYHSVFYQKFVHDSLLLVNQKVLINYSYKPRIGAYTDAGYVSSLATGAARNFGFSFGVSLVVPIYDAHQRAMQLRKVGIAEDTRLAQREYFVNQYRQLVAQLNQQLRATDALVSSIQQQITYANTLITANSKLLAAGDIRITDYVLALNNYLSIQNLLNQNNINRLRIVNQLSYWNR
ncbi:MAG: TolC family protein [Williamsia sp.]|nr:TolC family protein [Williamsia sp.]